MSPAKAPEARTVAISDRRCTEGEDYAFVTVTGPEELATWLHGVYKISKALASAYAQVVLAGNFLTIDVGADSMVHIHTSDYAAVSLPLRHTVLHPGGLTQKEAWATEQAERDINAYAAMRRSSVRRPA